MCHKSLCFLVKNGGIDIDQDYYSWHCFSSRNFFYTKVCYCLHKSSFTVQ